MLLLTMSLHIAVVSFIELIFHDNLFNLIELRRLFNGVVSVFVDLFNKFAHILLYLLLIFRQSHCLLDL